VGPRAGFDVVEKRKSYTAANRTQDFRPVARRFNDRAIPLLAVSVIGQHLHSHYVCLRLGT
jgi:hypothetical protein